jgi:hypothetical protein
MQHAWRGRKYKYKLLVGKRKGLKRIRVDRRILLKCILKKYGGGGCGMDLPDSGCNL